MSDENRRMWERMKGETDAPWEAFNVYLSLKAHSKDPTERRTLENVAAKLNKSPTVISRWSAHNAWVERARAYDDDSALTAFETRVVNLAEVQRATLRQESEEITVITEIIQGKLKEALLNAQSRPEEVAVKDLKQLVETADTLMKMRRRLAQLPATFLTAVSEDKTNDENEAPAEFVIGAKS